MKNKIKNSLTTETDLNLKEKLCKGNTFLWLAFMMVQVKQKSQKYFY
jgi:hypothetical protein